MCNISNIAMSQFQSKWKKQDNETIAQLEYTWLEGPLLTKERNLESKIQSNICLTLKACHFWGSTGAMALQYFGRSAKSISNGAGGAYMPTTILLALLDFQTFLPPCIEFNVNIFCHNLICQPTIAFFFTVLHGIFSLICIWICST